jgi:hypothetical protein
MLSFFGRSPRFCDGLSRRAFLKVGAMGFGGLTLPHLLRLRAEGAVQSDKKHKAVIMVFLSGGPSHLDSYDMKPDLPSEFRGEFNPIRTNVPGLQICEHMPLQAKMADKLAVLRGVNTVGNHTGNEFFSGFPYEQGKKDAKTNEMRPAFGCIVSKLRGGDSVMSAYVSLHDVESYEPPVYAGKAHAPFRFHFSARHNEAMDNLRLAPGVSRECLEDRQALLKSFDTLRRDIDATRTLDGLDAFQAKALEIVVSGKVRDAFDLDKEPAKLKEAYGKEQVMHGFTPGTLFLQARRLVEAGVSVVGINIPGWDTHVDNFKVMRQQLPVVDRALCALITDLHERGLEDDVTILMAGEMGRDPRISKEKSGREHWPQAGIAVMAGGGLKTGQVLGASDARGAEVKGKAITPQMMLATLYHTMGIDPCTTIPDLNGRPMYLLEEREKIEELI